MSNIQNQRTPLMRFLRLYISISVIILTIISTAVFANATSSNSLSMKENSNKTAAVSASSSPTTTSKKTLTFIYDFSEENVLRNNNFTFTQKNSLLTHAIAELFFNSPITGNPISSLSKTCQIPDDNSLGYKKDGYYFVEWNTSPDGTGIAIKAKKYTNKEKKELFELFKVNNKKKTIKLYPIYKSQNITIKFDFNGGTVYGIDGSYSNTVKYEAPFCFIDADTWRTKKYGYTFSGWTINEKDVDITNLNMVSDYYVYSSGTDLELIIKAQWKLNVKPIENVIEKNIDASYKTAKIESFHNLTNIKYQDLTSIIETDNKSIMLYDKAQGQTTDTYLKSYIMACEIYTMNKNITPEKINEDTIASIVPTNISNRLKNTEIFTVKYTENKNIIRNVINTADYNAILKSFNISKRSKNTIKEITEKILSILYTDKKIYFINDNIEIIFDYGWHKDGFNYGTTIKLENRNVYSTYSGIVTDIKNEIVTIKYDDGMIVEYSGFYDISVNKNERIYAGECIGFTEENCEITLKYILGKNIIAPNNTLLKDLEYDNYFIGEDGLYKDLKYENYLISKNGVLWIATEEAPVYVESSNITEKLTKKTKFSDLFYINNSEKYKYIDDGVFSIDIDEKTVTYYSTEYYKFQSDYFILPLQQDDAFIISKYGERESINGKTSTTHRGVDQCCESGTLGKSVSAMAGGKIIESGWSAYGNYVMIDHGNGFVTLYGHLDSCSVETGDIVRQGDEIGKAGTTYGEGGYSTGPHLHFEIRIDGEKVNPEDYLEM